jgi:hypothetical protein
MTARAKDVRADWIAALGRFRNAARAFDAWNAHNPCPREGQLPDDADADAIDACFAAWEKGSDAVAGPYDKARDKLRALPAPDLDAVIVKLGMVRDRLEGHSVKRELAPYLQAIERDLRRLAGKQDCAKIDDGLT